MSEWEPQVDTIRFESTGRHVDIVRNPNVISLIASGAFDDDDESAAASAVRAREIIRAMLKRPRLVDDPADVSFVDGSEAVLFEHIAESEVAELLEVYREGAASAATFRGGPDRAGGSDGGENVGVQAKRGSGGKARKPPRPDTG